jgi:hypothetical protein
MELEMRNTIFLVSVVAAGLVPAAAHAQGVMRQHYAIRSGIGVNPDQFHSGMHVELGSLSRAQLRPVVDLGFGNGVRLLSLGGDVLYHFRGAEWRPYLGGGPGINFFDVTDGVGQTDGLQTRLVAHGVVGLAWMPRRSRYGYLVEGRIGVGDTPDVHVAAGISF